MKPYYQDDACTIYHGDCREILPTLGKVDLVLTDPPYGIGRLMVGGKNTGHWGKLSSGNSWDIEAPSMEPILALKTDSIIWGGNYFNLPPSRCWYIWRKLGSVPTMADVEMAWTSFDKNSRHFEYSIHAYADERSDRPTPKPQALMMWCLNQHPDAHTILDPFMGSGTTLRAAKDLGRKAIGIEIEEKYCEIAVKRLRQEVLL